MPQGLINFAYARRTAAGTTALAAAPGATKRHVIVSVALSQDVATAIATVESGTTDLITLDGVNAIALSGDRTAPVAECAPNEALNFTTVGAGNASCNVGYITVPI